MGEVDLLVLFRATAGFLIVLAASVITAISVHEAGHLLFGRLGGYACYGVAILGCALTVIDGQVTVRRTKPFLAGKCFLAPAVEKTRPVMAAAGGPVMNQLTGTLMLLCMIFSDEAGTGFVFLIFAVINLAMGASNLTDTSVTGDGATIRELRRYKGNGACYDRLLLLEKRAVSGDTGRDGRGGKRWHGGTMFTETVPMPEDAGGHLALELGVIACCKLAACLTTEEKLAWISLEGSRTQ